MKLPRGYLSWSSVDLWRKSKEQYRSRYYRNEEQPDSPEMRFGKKVAKMLEDRAFDEYPFLKDVMKLPVSEHQILVDIGGIPVKAYLDMYDPATHSFLEFKTGKKKPDGMPRWSPVEVAKHDQLPFYSLLIEESEGEVENMTHLVWLETEFEMKTVEFDGHALEGSSRELRLTGQVEVFPRKIEKWERARMKDLLIKTANEITDDYEVYLKES